MRTAVVIGGLLLLAVGIGPAKAGSPRPQETPGPAVRVGEKAPDFTLNNLKGEPVTLSAQRGKVIILNFWATWCPPCRVEMPSMERLNEVFGSKDFIMLAVNVEEDGQKTVPKFLRSHPHSFPILLDPEAEIQQRYGVFRFPETFIIDKNGVIVNHVIGARDWADVEMLRYINSLIEG